MARTAKTKTKKSKMSNETIAAIKAFKASSEVESFYQFIHENNLRSEAHNLMSVVLKSLSTTKRKKKVLQ